MVTVGGYPRPQHPVRANWIGRLLPLQDDAGSNPAWVLYTTDVRKLAQFGRALVKLDKLTGV